MSLSLSVGLYLGLTHARGVPKISLLVSKQVGYEVIDSQRGAKRRVGYNHRISNKREWNVCFIKNHQLILLYFADFAWLIRTTRRQFNGRYFSSMV